MDPQLRIEVFRLQIIRVSWVFEMLEVKEGDED